MLRRPIRPAFSLLELLVSMSIVSVLIAILLPVLSGARAASHKAMCASNLKQIGVAWQLYLDQYGAFPQHVADAGDEDAGREWGYGGAIAATASVAPVLDPGRPINRYLSNETTGVSGQAEVFKCPADTGVRISGPHGRKERQYQYSVFGTYGTSYRGNSQLFYSRFDQGDLNSPPLRLSEIDTSLSPSRLLLIGDAVWYFEAHYVPTFDETLHMSWHGKPKAGNMLAVDGSARFVNFAQGSSEYTLDPRRQ